MLNLKKIGRTNVPSYPETFFGFGDFSNEMFQETFITRIAIGEGRYRFIE